jgi:NAD(P)-dependent dehydrogenase (short-subunit alcohol dehydrogenase family)
MSQTVKNKIAVVTGASRGIGRATALRLAKEGAEVFVHYSASKDAADTLVKEIEGFGGKAHAVHADLNDSQGAEKLASQIPGTIDILVNNAGVAEYVSFEDTTPEQFDKLFNVNVKSLYFVTQKLAKKINNGGRIVNISSVVARVNFAGVPAYSATKGAVNTLTVHLAALFGEREITVNSISPGAIETDMSAWLRNEQGEATARQIQAIPRVGRAEDIADAVSSIAGPDGRWITGQVIEVSGGTKL